MRDQQNGITGGVLAAVVGGVLLFIAYSRDELGDIIKKGLAADERKCSTPREQAQSPAHPPGRPGRSLSREPQVAHWRPDRI